MRGLPAGRPRKGVNMRRVLPIAFACVLVLSCAGGGQIPQELVDALIGPQRDRTTAGVREALEIATRRAVARTSLAGGFSADELIRVRLPDALARPARVLRRVGLGRHVDDLEAGMNRAAERASAEAIPLFVDAVRALTFADARRIVQGGDTAATDYFRVRTETGLAARFRPEVQAAMRRVGLYREYEELLGAYDALPLTDKPNLDLADHVTGRTIDGLFDVLGREERRIRRDPVARTTELLREVFGD